MAQRGIEIHFIEFSDICLSILEHWSGEGTSFLSFFSDFLLLSSNERSSIDFVL